MNGAAARIYDEPAFFDRNVVTLAIRDNGGAFLLRDGTWYTGKEGEAVTDMGILLPRHVIEPIAVAIAEWQGHTSHADTEARVLREWLAVEQARVDRALLR
jgi:hypothetical protein